MFTASIETSPAVKLSPKARKRVKRSRGGGRTATTKLHDAPCPRESVAWQVTPVEPTANEPGCDEQVVETGATPPAVCGDANETFTGAPSSD